MSTTTIAVDQSVITLVNVFTVTPETQTRLVDLLVEATSEVMRRLPGFVSANIHASLDGTRVVNYAQWRSPEDFRSMLEHPAARQHMAAAANLASSEPHLYELVSVHHA